MIPKRRRPRLDPGTPSYCRLDVVRRRRQPERIKTRDMLGFLRKADDGARTRDPQLGKLMLYQLSYVRVRSRLAQSLVRGIASKARLADHLSMFKLQEWRSEEGQTMAEYGVILAVITPAIIAALALVAYKTAENLESVVAVIT
jgi:Flp pilus assembly pilin Flp